MNRVVKENIDNKNTSPVNYIAGTCLPQTFVNTLDRIENFEVHDSDIWLCSFPRTGTTWSQEMTWCIANNLDFEKGKNLLLERFPYLEFSMFHDVSALEKLKTEKFPEFIVESVNYVSKYPNPRFIKCHLPFHLLPKQIRAGERKPKIIYISRDVKDTCISFFHNYRRLVGYNGSFNDFCTLFMEGKLNYAPFWKHVLSFWESNQQKNILFLKYEDMKAKLPSVIRKTANFLGKLITENEVKLLEEHLSFERMTANPALSFGMYCKMFRIIGFEPESEEVFYRCGKVNQWKEEMSKEMIDRFETWTEKSLRGTNFPIL